jgi:hypothetical protein
VEYLKLKIPAEWIDIRAQMDRRNNSRYKATSLDEENREAMANLDLFRSFDRIIISLLQHDKEKRQGTIPLLQHKYWRSFIPKSELVRGDEYPKRPSVTSSLRRLRGTLSRAQFNLITEIIKGMNKRVNSSDVKHTAIALAHKLSDDFIQGHLIYSSVTATELTTPTANQDKDNDKSAESPKTPLSLLSSVLIWISLKLVYRSAPSAEKFIVRCDLIGISAETFVQTERVICQEVSWLLDDL